MQYSHKNECLKDLNKINQILVGEIKELNDKISYEKSVNEEKEKHNEDVNQQIEHQNQRIIELESILEEK